MAYLGRRIQVWNPKPQINGQPRQGEARHPAKV